MGRTPISEGYPAGSDPRENPHYEALQAEMAKLSSLQGAGAVRWEEVAHNAAAVLSTQAKDISASVWLCAALAELKGIAGLADGTRILADVVTLWWDSCFPPLKRLRARSNMLQWWRDRTKDFISRESASEPEASRDLLDALSELDAALAEKLPDMPPLRDLLDAVRSLPGCQKSVAPPDMRPDDLPDDAHPASSSAALAATTAAPLSSVPLPSDPHEARQCFLAAADAFCVSSFAQGCAQDAAAWRALYLALWGGLHSVPPSENGLTRIAPPSSEALQSCTALIAAGKAEDAALAAVRFLPQSPFCLDAQRILDVALTECGPPWVTARVLLRQEVRAFLNRLPGVEELRFNDGTPFADPATALWLGSILAEGETAAAVDAPPQESPIQEALREAERLAAQTQTAQALELLHAARRSTGAAGAECAETFPLLLKEAEILMRRQHWAAATAVAQCIEETIARHNLPVWDAQSALDGLAVAHAAWSGLGGEEAQRRARSLLVKIARLRPAQALALTGG
ncbi:type VI secretion system protein TssA [Desulfovibrio sp. ZJ369]|uniref:type VI secretion system protein TssA n=1 Tax=Desulfovibrio sp. ZJ369 TaxID=2709793 RepID=UPI0013ECF635|nr:type VI secretion system protein TssA [Desulfovibrio sp. ZJ369]